MKFHLGIVDSVFERYSVARLIVIRDLTWLIFILKAYLQQMRINVKSCFLHVFLNFKSTSSIVQDHRYWKLRATRSKNLFKVLSRNDVELYWTKFSKCDSAEVWIECFSFDSYNASKVLSRQLIHITGNLRNKGLPTSLHSGPGALNWYFEAWGVWLLRLCIENCGLEERLL